MYLRKPYTYFVSGLGLTLRSNFSEEALDLKIIIFYFICGSARNNLSQECQRSLRLRLICYLKWST